MIGGTYRLASIAIDIGTEELPKQTRRTSEELGLRRRHQVFVLIHSVKTLTAKVVLLPAWSS